MTMSKLLSERKTPAGTAYIEAGTGESLVLIHGVGLNKQVWQPQLDEFSNAFRVIAYDTLGHGNSPDPANLVSLDDYFDQMVELLDTLALPRVNLCGHSMGALITLGFSLKYPQRVDRIVPMMAAYDRPPEHQQRSRRVADILAGPGAGLLLDATLERWFSEQDAADPVRQARITQVRKWLQQVHKDGYSRAYRTFAENGETYVGQLHNIAAPAFFITAENDPNSTPAMSRRMAREVQRGQVFVMTGERHMGQYLGAEEIMPLMRNFLETPLPEEYPNG
jgi:pimeloyl-ACP methyl ester carboxylesterase